MEAPPDFAVIMKNIASTFPSIYTMLAAVFMLMAFITAFSALLDLAQASDRQKKYFGVGHHATAWSGIFKLFIAGFMANFAADGQMISIVSSIFFDDYSHSLVSIDSYVAASTVDPMKKYLHIIFIGFTQILGLVAIFKGLRIWAKAADKTGREGFWHGFNYLVFGTLCIQVARVIATIQSTLGYDFFKMIGFI